MEQQSEMEGANEIVMVESSSDKCSDHGDCDSEYDFDVLIKQDDFAEYLCPVWLRM